MFNVNIFFIKQMLIKLNMIKLLNKLLLDLNKDK